MSSWIPPLPFSFSISWPSSTPHAEGSEPTGLSTSPPPAPARNRQRFPVPPARGGDLQSAQGGSPFGHKRARDLMSWAGASEAGCRACDSDANLNCEQEEDEGPERKRRKRGIVRTVLEGALDAAVFSTALGYSAYQLWKNPPSKDDVDALVQSKQRLMLADSPHSASRFPTEAPPPYSEQNSRNHPSASTSPAQPTLPFASPSPSQIPRKVRHAHEARPRLSSRRSTFPPSPPKPSSFSFSVDSALPLASSSRDPLVNLAQEETPEFQPYASPKIRSLAISHSGFEGLQADDGDGDDVDFEEDEEMKAVSDRLKSLIETGREALASRPREWSEDTSTSTGTSRSRFTTTSSTTSTSTVDSPRKPSPLSQFTSRFDSTTTVQPLAPSFPRHSLPNAFTPSYMSSSSASPNHSRRHSLDTGSRIPTSTPALYDAASTSSSSRTGRHRHTKSHGGSMARHSLGGVGEEQEGVVDEFEKVLQKAKARSSLGGGGAT